MQKHQSIWHKVVIFSYVFLYTLGVFNAGHYCPHLFGISITRQRVKKRLQFVPAGTAQNQTGSALVEELCAL